MNIETLNDSVKSFKQQIIDSGFTRDLTDYVASIPKNQGNIVGLKEIARSVLTQLQKIHSGDLPAALVRLFPAEKPIPFTERDYHIQLEQLLEDKAMQQEQFYNNLNGLLTKLRNDLDSNSQEVNKIAAFIEPYVSKERVDLEASDKAVFSIIFNDEKTISELSELSKTIALWNRTLPLYHQLVTKTSSENIRLLEVQNGSIDLVINLNAHVAVSFAHLFKVGFMAYGAYLAHKKNLLALAQGYLKNRKLLALDEEKDKLLLENIHESVAAEAKEQHMQAAGKGQVDNPEKIVERVSALVTSHIVKGNDVKILALPAGGGTGEEAQSEISELREVSASVRNAFKELPAKEKQLLLSHYGDGDADEKPAVLEKKKRRKKGDEKEKA